MVAIKIFDKENMKEEEVQAARQEINIMSTLDHAKIM